MTKITTQAQMAAHDEKTAALIDRAGDISIAIERVYARMHSMVRDRKEGYGRSYRWTLTDRQAESRVQQLLAEGDRNDLSVGATPSELLHQLTALQQELAATRTQIGILEETYEDSPWPRYIECTNRDGHVHRFTGCPTLNRGMHLTSLIWRPELSGHSVQEAVDALGPMLCSVCFPQAPAEHCQSRSQATAAQRAAEREARERAKYEREQAAAQRRAERAARAAEPRKASAADKRTAALRALYARHQDPQDREALAADIEELLPLGRSESWQNAITEWAALVRDTDNSITWAYAQGSVYAAGAAG